jgi:hypothetical protein
MGVIVLATLKAEINTDPAGRGYAAVRENREAVAALVNEFIASVQINRALVDAWEVTALIDPTDFSALTQLSVSRLSALLSAGKLAASATNIRTMLVGTGAAPSSGIFGNGSTTKTNLLALLTRNGSRAEALFGENTRVTSDDVSRALLS